MYHNFDLVLHKKAYSQKFGWRVRISISQLTEFYCKYASHCQKLLQDDDNSGQSHLSKSCTRLFVKNEECATSSDKNISQQLRCMTIESISGLMPWVCSESCLSVPGVWHWHDLTGSPEVHRCFAGHLHIESYTTNNKYATKYYFNYDKILHLCNFN